MHHILRNKTYVGIRTYKDGENTMEVKGCWEPIVDANTFNRVQILLSKNKSAKKPHSEKRFPYLLTGFTFCVKCGNHLCGKSAHGRGGKVPYYEHSWATKRNSYLTKKIFACDPHRVPAKKLELLVVEKVKELLQKPEIFEELTKSFERMDRKNPIQKERERVESQIHGLTSQLDALAERLSILPKGVSASPIFKQMEKIEIRKAEFQKLLRAPDISDFGAKGTCVDVKELFHRLALIFNDDANSKLRAQVIKRLIHKVEVGVDSVKIHYHIGERYLKGELEAVIASGPDSFQFGADPQKNLLGGSNSLTNGAG